MRSSFQGAIQEIASSGRLPYVFDVSNYRNQVLSSSAAKGSSQYLYKLEFQPSLETQLSYEAESLVIVFDAQIKLADPVQPPSAR